MTRRLALLVIVVALALYPTRDSAQTANSAPKAASEMADAALKFWNALTPDQQKQAGFAFDDPERINWHFTPVVRKGLPWKSMTPAQRDLGHAMLKVGLSEMGYTKAEATQLNETTLGAMEKVSGNTRNVRDPENYYITIFGKPDRSGTWGWRFEGHHAAFNFTIADGQIAVGSPNFFGANPAKVPEGQPKAGSRILAAEEDLGRALVKALNEEQQKVAIFDKTAPGEIFTKEESRPNPLKPVGILASQFNKAQHEMLWSIIKEYANRLRPDLAMQDILKIDAAGIDKVYFGWAGTIEVGGPHYYRVQGPTFLIEYDNTQNDANHVHAVWRDAANDFGQDILKQHYMTQPH